MIDYRNNFCNGTYVEMPIILKTSSQIEGIRKASRLASQTLDYIEPFVKAGITTLELNDLIDKYTRDHNAIPAPLNYKGFPRSCCTSINEVICHGVPDQRPLREGDIVNIDVTPILDGYYGDTCRMFTVGNVSKKALRLIEVTKRCLEIGIEQVKPGNRIGQIGHAISKFAESKGFSVVESFGGHGVGLAFHEEPFVLHKAKPHEGPVMEPGMVFTIEPMICARKPEAMILEDGWTAVTRDGGLSAQFEHTCLVTPTGVEILTVSC